MLWSKVIPNAIPNYPDSNQYMEAAIKTRKNNEIVASKQRLDHYIYDVNL